MALPKAYRLRRRQDFNQVYQRGRRYTGKRLTVRFLYDSRNRTSTKVNHAHKLAQLQPPLAAKSKAMSRFGISISQKVSKKAVVRNRIKRQIHAAILQMLPRISPGWLVVIGVHPAAAECDYVDFLRELEQLLAEAEVLNGHSRGSLL